MCCDKDVQVVYRLNECQCYFMSQKNKKTEKKTIMIDFLGKIFLMSQ